jgi:multiple sugar transport system substrate-binding protein
MKLGHASWLGGKSRARGGSPRRASALASVAVATGLALAAYGGASAASSAAGGTGFSGLTGNLTISAQGGGAAIVLPVIKAFEKLNPGLHVTYSPNTVGGASYVTQLLTEKLAGDLPDIVNPDDVNGPQFAYDGITANLAPYLAKCTPYCQSYWLPNLVASYIPNQGKLKGGIYGLPNEADAIIIVYNATMFKKAGLPLPTNNWGWTQLLHDAHALRVVKDGVQTQFGFCWGPDGYINYNPFLAAFEGHPVFTATGADLDSPQALRAWQLMLTPETNGDAMPITQVESGDCGTTQFASGEVAMIQTVRGGMPAFRSAIGNKFQWDVVPMPLVPTPTHGLARPTGAGSIGWALTTEAKDVHNALAFLKYVYSEQGMAVQEASYGVIPPTSSGMSSGEPWMKLAGPPYDIQAFVIASKAGTVAPELPGTSFSDFSKDVTTAVEAVLVSHQSYAQAFGTLQSEANAFYSAANKS